MKQDKLHDAMNYLDDDLIADVGAIREACRRRKARKRLLASVALAACLCIVVTVLTVTYNMGRSPMQNAAEMLADRSEAGSELSVSAEHTDVTESHIFAENSDDRWQDGVLESTADSEDKLYEGVGQEEEDLDRAYMCLELTVTGYEDGVTVCVADSELAVPGIRRGDTLYLATHADTVYTFSRAEGTGDDTFYGTDSQGHPVLDRGTRLKVCFNSFSGNEHKTLYADSIEIY